MQPLRQRRNCRLALSIPIRVYGIDFRGIDFVEDTSTLVVSLRGAKIRLLHQLLPDQEIRLLSLPTNQEAIFRVVTKVAEHDPPHTFWGVECLEGERNIWGVEFPELRPKDQASVRLLVQCPVCGTREWLDLDEPLVESMNSADGIRRGCLACGKSGLWKPVAYPEVCLLLRSPR
jgi:hypothetical protein